MIQRISRSLSDVAKEVLQDLKDNHGVTDKQLQQLRGRVANSGNQFPLGGIKVRKNVLWIDYQVQRDVIKKTILSLLKKWDNRICQPAACYTDPKNVKTVDAEHNIYEFTKLFIYDAQHRCITLAILGAEEFYVTVVVESDKRFPSYAFRTSNSVVKKIGKPDFHRNNLRLYDLNVHDNETIPAHNLQAEFDRLKIDLVEESIRNSTPVKQRKHWYMSHYDYAYKPMGSDPSGEVAGQILEAITKAWPNQEKIQNGVYVGMYHMNEVMKSLGKKLPKSWMTEVCQTVSASFSNPAALESAAERHAKWVGKSTTWNVPESMFKFIREVYRLNGGKLVIPADGAEYDLDRGVWVTPDLIPNHKSKYRKPIAQVKEIDYDFA
jgi:hypothetical protein